MLNSRLNLLFVLESFFPDNRAGTEIYVINLCHYFINKGWKVGVLISTTLQTNDYEYEGITVYTFRVPQKPIAKELNGIIPPRGIEHFIERINVIKPDIIHFHSFGRAINGHHLQAAKDLGVKTAFTPHLGSFFCIKGDLLLNGKSNCDGKVNQSRCLRCLLQSSGKNNLLSKGIAGLMQYVTRFEKTKRVVPPALFQAYHRQNELQRVKQHADVVFAIAPWIQHAFRLNDIAHSVLIPQGISPVFFEKSSTSQRLNFSIDQVQQINFAFIGRMHPSKGFHLLRQAWDTLNTTNCQLTILTNSSGGENSYFEENKKWSQTKENVNWHEGLSQHEVANHLKIINILILPSISNEVAPLVVLEAAAFGIPTIGSDYIAIKDMVEHGKNGLLFKNGDWHDLKLQLETIIKQPELITAFKQNIQPPVSMSLVAEIIEKEYKRILEL